MAAIILSLHKVSSTNALDSAKCLTSDNLHYVVLPKQNQSSLVRNQTVPVWDSCHRYPYIPTPTFSLHPRSTFLIPSHLKHSLSNQPKPRSPLQTHPPKPTILNPAHSALFSTQNACKAPKASLRTYNIYSFTAYNMSVVDYIGIRYNEMCCNYHGSCKV